MSFQIVNEDLAKIKCDAIVNPTNPYMCLYWNRGNVDSPNVNAALRTLAQSEKFQVGDVHVTEGFGLPVKYIIHTFLPNNKYFDDNDDNKILVYCYGAALERAKELGCKSVAIPLFPVYPKLCSNDEMLIVIFKTIRKILAEKDDMQIYLSYNYSHCGDLVQEFFNYAYEDWCKNNRMFVDFIDVRYLEKTVRKDNYGLDAHYDLCRDLAACPMRRGDSVGFLASLTKFIEQSGMSEVECYKKANVSRQTWSKMVKFPYYAPSKRTIAAFAIALRLNIDDAQKLMEEGGYWLSKNYIFDLIIRYCIENGIYDTDKVDDLLYDYGERTLFSVE